MNFTISFLIGYLIGSFPSAYVLLKKLKGIDITKEGSQNVGALNSYEVSNSWYIGAAVLVLDFAKGLLSVFLVQNLFGDHFIYPALSILAAVLAHCYNPWIKFMGGKGLATGAGGIILLSPLVLLLWVVFWIISYLFRKDINLSNSMATILTAAIIAVNPSIINKYSLPPAESGTIAAIILCTILLIIQSKHLKHLVEYFCKQNKKLRNSENE
ncbi:MAG: glycerol-3-phosphate acyltransferase [Ignavibacteria bacterium]|jgi:glycerol-3-phosphate acyltransferase PlsY